jgi:hypothetical protein
MSLIASSISFVGRVGMSLASRFFNPKEIVVDIGMPPNEFVADNLRNRNLDYAFARRDKVIASVQKGWKVAVGRRKLVLTEHYVDRLGELILLCKEKSTQ